MLPLPLPPAVVAVMRRQHGLVTRSQVTRHVRPAVVDGWLRRGALERVARGVYRLPSVVHPPAQPVMAAVLRCGRGARAGGWTSAWLHRLEGIRAPATVDVALPSPRHVRRDELPCRVRSTLLERADLTTVEGIPCLSATRALVEIAPDLPERALRVAIDSARRNRSTSLPLLRRRAEALEHHRGARVLRRLLGAGDLDPESEGERAMRTFLTPLGLPLEWGVTDLVPGRRLDAACRPALVGFEYDGRDHHVLPTDRDADGLRDLEAAERQVLIVRITAGMIREAPAETLARIASICAARCPDLGHLHETRAGRWERAGATGPGARS